MQENICPECNSQIVTPLLGPPHQLTIEEEIAATTRELEHADDSPCHLHKKRVALLRRLNDLQSPLVLLLPEILSTIFHFACIPTYTKGAGRQLNIGTLISLGSVCSVWRQTAWSTPVLWTTLIADIAYRDAESAASILGLCLRNAGAMPLHLDLRLRGYISEYPWHHDPVDRVANLIFKNETASNTRVLHLQNPPDEWVHLLSTGFENLEDLSLVRTSWSRSRVTFPHLPRLRRLLVKNMSFFDTGSFANTITTLEVTHVDVDFFRHAYFPVLQRLRLTSPVTTLPSFFSTEVLRDFLGRSPPTLISLELCKWTSSRGRWSSSPPDDLRQLLPCLPTSIEDLSLFECSDRLIPQVLQRLITEEVSVKTLPNLGRLCIAGNMSKECWGLITKMILTRELGRGTPFKLLLPPLPQGRRSRAATENLEALVRGGQVVLEYHDSTEDLS